MSPNSTSAGLAVGGSTSDQPRSGVSGAGVARSERACGECRRMKVRCMRAGDEPCQRCQHTGVECVLAASARKRRAPRSSWAGSNRTPLDEGISPGRIHGGSTGSDELRAAKRRMVDLEKQLGLLRSEMDVLGGFGEVDQGNTRPVESSRAVPSLPPPWIGAGTSNHQPADQQRYHEDASHRDYGQSSPPSPSRADDLLTSDHLVAPFRQLRSMADERNESRATSPDHSREHAAMGSSRDVSVNDPPDGTAWQNTPNRNRAQDALVSVLHSVITSSHKAKPDVITLGLVGEDEARELYDYFFANCNEYVLVHDSKVDTWEAMRSRSPIALATIIAVGAMARDGAGAVSETQRNALQLAQALVLGTVYDRNHRLEDVQSVITLGVYHRNCWLLSGLAIRLATDMGVDSAFSKLLASGMGADLTPAKMEQDRDLVIRARLWFALYAHEVQMSFGNGRSPIIRGDETIVQCRRFLDHPLAITSDVRLIAVVEILMLRTPLHLQLANSSGPFGGEHFVETLQRLKIDLDNWYKYYDDLMRDRLKMDATGYYRESLRTQREYASLFANSLLLRGISHTSDLRRLSHEEYILALSAVRSAQVCLDIVVRGNTYPRMLKFAIPHTRMSVAFAASFLLRTAPLFPDRVDRHSTAKDVETLASMLADCGARRLSRALRILLLRAVDNASKRTVPASGPGDVEGGRDHSVQSLPSDLEAGTFNPTVANLDLHSAFDYSLSTQDPLSSNGFDFPFGDFWDTTPTSMFMPDQTLPLEGSASFGIGQVVPSEVFPDPDFNMLLGSLSNIGSM